MIDGLPEQRALRPSDPGLIDREPVGAVGPFERRVRVAQPSLKLWRHPASDVSRDVEGIADGAIGGAGGITLIQGGHQRCGKERADAVVSRPVNRIPAVARRNVDGHPPGLRQQELILLDQLFVLHDRLDVITRVVHHPLRLQRNRQQRARRARGEPACPPCSCHRSPPCGSYAGNSRSFVRNTLMRNPSRIVMVGSTFKYRSRMRLADVARLAPAACR